MIPSKFKFNNIKLSKKLLILYIFSVFLPIILTNVIFYQVTTENIRNQKMKDLSLTLEQITNDFLDVVDHAGGISSGLYTDANLYDFFEEDYVRIIDYIEAYDSYIREFNRYSPIYYSIQSINFYTDNPSVIYAGGIHPIIEPEWYDEVTSTSHPIVTRTKFSNTFSVIRELDYYPNQRKYQKIIKIDLNPNTIKEIFESVTFQGNVYLVNEKDYIEYTADKNVDWRAGTTAFDSLKLSSDTIIFDENHFKGHYLNGWKVVGTITEQEILNEVYQSGRFIIVLASLNFFIPTLIIILISRSLHVRILRIVKHMKKVKRQDFETIKQGEKDKDEIGELTSEFNRMTRTINQLINDVYVANIQKKDLEIKEKQAQLSALQSQINPHFLFNALETIRMRSIIKEEVETAKIIQNMAKIFRNSLTWGKDWVTVREEMKLIICFLEIQQYRFGDKLEYHIDIEDQVYNYKIPNMAFLPFVENASIHGVEPIKGIGRINLQIQLIDDSIVYTLTDNGMGMTEETLHRLMESLKNEEEMGTSVGVKNVYYRLKMYYGQDFEFTIKSSPGEGTTVKISLPCKNVGQHHSE
ncbi:sensor histidine kinase [Halalkalibacter urbisdiaboli]|uniref:sensor histidine kinase n=1 Tax=Halalkalibacter urbisdiaboli TaxID=1960589 RepID=UPI000B42E236|nr:sensor histidine kinase [Halalkalibacter urbisdiaboli]